MVGGGPGPRPRIPGGRGHELRLGRGGTFPHAGARKVPLDTELAPVAYEFLATVKFLAESAASIAFWSRSTLLCSVTSEPGT